MAAPHSNNQLFLIKTQANKFKELPKTVHGSLYGYRSETVYINDKKILLPHEYLHVIPHFHP